MNIHWLIRRLSVMSIPEIFSRARTTAKIRLEHAGLGLAEPSLPDLNSFGNMWVSALPENSFATLRYKEKADAILAGKIDVFALRQLSLGFPPDWNRDPKTGTVAPLKFGKSIDYRNEALVGDCKYSWEPNRHFELVTLAQAWKLSSEPRYLEGCVTLLDSWIEQCPYPLGINWTSSLELAIRLNNWAIAWHLIGANSNAYFKTPAGKEFLQKWFKSIYCHCHFISQYYSRYSSANNHLLGEYLGLFVACVTWPLWPESHKWLNEARSGFENEALLQNYPDGVNREQGIWYHHEVTDMMLLAYLLARANNISFSKSYEERLERMLEFIASLMNKNGQLPAWGDADDAIVVKLNPFNDFDPYQSLLATGSVVFERGDFKFKAGDKFDDKSKWLLGEDGLARFNALKKLSLKTPIRSAFKQGGYFILGGEFETEREVRIVADVAELGYLKTAAHGHADALSFTLSASGHEIFIDPGTYAYHTQKKWRDYFRGTAAHNTLRVDGQDQSAAGGNFLWTRHAKAVCEQWSETPELIHLIGSHDGYHALKHSITHRREWRYGVAARQLLVVDSLSGTGRHTMELFWHFAEHCQVSYENSVLTIERANVVVTVLLPKNLSVSVLKGGEEPIGGWISRHFDEKTPCTTVVAAGSFVDNWLGTTSITVEFL
jgi:hypothetical protein